MSAVDPSGDSLKTIIENAQRLRWIRLSTLVLMLWDHSECYCFRGRRVDVHRFAEQLRLY